MVLLKSTFEGEFRSQSGRSIQKGDHQVIHSTQKLISEYLRLNTESIVNVGLQDTFQAVDYS